MRATYPILTGLAALVVGCASGAPQPATLEEAIEGQGDRPLSPPPSADDNGGAGSSARAMDAMDTDAGAAPTPVGDACTQGDVEPCLCVESGTAGERRCIFDSVSPLDGFFGECARCAQPEPEAQAPDAGPPTRGEPDATDDAADADGMGQTPPSTQSPQSTPATPSTPAAQASTTGCLANPSMCTALLQCCRPDGICGVGLPGVLCL